MDVTGTSDEQPEEAGRRRMVIHVTGERLTIEAADPVIVEAGRAALHALGDQADPPGTIRGDLPVCASLGTAWQALQDSLAAIPAARHAARRSAGRPGRAGKAGKRGRLAPAGPATRPPPWRTARPGPQIPALAAACAAAALCAAGLRP